MAIKMFPDLDGLRHGGQNLSPFLVIKYIKNYSYQNMPLIKFVLLLLYSAMEKNHEDSADF